MTDKPAVIDDAYTAVMVHIVGGGYVVSWDATPIACFATVDELLAALRDWTGAV